MTQLTLPIPEYPHSDRYSNFDRDFIDLMLKLEIPQRLGAVAFALLVHVVRTEDARKFKDAPTFWIGSLAERSGVHRNNFKKHLTSVVESGWMFWHKDRDVDIGVGWVLVPMRYQSMLKSSRSFGAEPVDVQRNVAPSVARNVAPSVAPDVAHSIKETNPNPPTPPGWPEVEKGMIEFGILECGLPLKAIQDHEVSPALALGVLKHATETGYWKPGKVRRRLINLFPDHDPADETKWMQRDSRPAYPTSQGCEQPGRVPVDPLRQLEFDFGSELKDLTTLEIIERYDVPDEVAKELRTFPTWKHTVRTPWIRAAVLEVLAKRKQASQVLKESQT